MIKLFIKLILLLGVLVSIASAQVPLSEENYFEIKEKFLNQDSNTLSLAKLEKYKTHLETLSKQVQANIQNSSEQDLSDEEKIKLAKSNSFVKNMNRLISEWIDQAKEIELEVDLLEYLSKILDIERAIKVDNLDKYSEKRVLKSLSHFIKNFRLGSDVNEKFGEAKNLTDPGTGNYLEKSKLQEFITNGFDLSTLDPPVDNGVIELIDDISKVNPSARYYGENKLHKNLEQFLPADNSAHFKKLIKKEDHADVIVETKDATGEVLFEYVLKLGREIHSQPTAAALGATLGIYHDITIPVKNFKVYIGDLNWEDILLELSRQFDYEYIDRIVLNNGSDERGNFVIVKEGLIKVKFDEDKLQRVGPFYPNYKLGKREIRALMLFNMWIGNADLNARENNQTILKLDSNQKQLFYIQQDVGFAFGYYGAEKPTEFPWDLVKKRKNEKTVFNYRSFVPENDGKYLTRSDAKWMARKIAQLTRKQITECVKLGNWPSQAPYDYEQLIIEKLINRRNQLVEEFQLAGEVLSNGVVIKYMEVDRDIEKNAIPTKEFLEDYTVDFRASIKYNFIKPVLKTLRGGIIDGLAGISQRIDKISVPDTWFGLDQGGVIAQVLVGTTKQVMKNPEPQGKDDKYIVREGFKMGSRFGYGAMFSGIASYIKEYTLVYPVSDLSKIDEKGKFIVDVTMPYKIMLNFLPARHILITESYIEGAARARIETPLTGAGNETKISRINLARKIISKKEAGIVKYFEDTSKYGEVASKLFLKLGWFRLDQYMATFASGKMHRDIYVLELDGNTTEAIDEAVMNNNPYKIKENATKTYEIDSKFIENTSQLNIFGFFQLERRSRTDDYQVHVFNEQGEIESVDHQLEGTYIKRRAWKIITNGEERIARVTMSSRVKADNSLLNPYLSLNFDHVDLNTTAKEIDKAYVPFFNGIANDPNFIQFSAQEHSLSGKYGQINLRFREKIYKEGIERLLHLKSEEFWSELSALLGIQDIKEFSKSMISYQGRRYNLNRVKRKAKKVMVLIKNAQSEKSFRLRVKSLMKAIVESIPKKGQSQNPIILSALNRIMGKHNFFLKAELEAPEGGENYLPGGVSPYNVLGTRRNIEDRDMIKIQLGDALKIYNLF